MTRTAPLAIPEYTPQPRTLRRPKLPPTTGALLCIGLVACRAQEPGGATKTNAPIAGAASNPAASNTITPKPPTPNVPPAANRVGSTPAISANAQPADITIPPPDVDVHVINGRNIISAPVEKSPSEVASNPDAEVRVTFWTTPDGQKLPVPQRHEGSLAELELGAGDLSMLTPGEKRRLWIPGPTGMATLDVELLDKSPAAPTLPKR